MASDWRVTVTLDDLRFLQMVKQHYEVFAKAFERQDEKRTLGIMEVQKFHCEQLLLRVEAARTILREYTGPSRQ